MTTTAAQFGTSSWLSRPVQAVLFDFDGTLWDPEPHIFRCYAEIFRDYGCVLPDSLWSSVIGTIGFDLWTHLEEASGIPVNWARIERSVRRRTAALLAEVTIRPGIPDLLAAVDAAGLMRGIVSNNTRSWIRRYAAQCAIADGWTTICSADGDPTLAKPSPYLYHRALTDLGVGADRVLAFEDSPSGVRAATAAGIRCIAVPNQMTANLDLSAADLLVDSYENVDLSRLLHVWTDPGQCCS
jgi:HAD superfamily hydrolase (TIGR01509 family)